MLQFFNTNFKSVYRIELSVLFLKLFAFKWAIPQKYKIAN